MYYKQAGAGSPKKSKNTGKAPELPCLIMRRVNYKLDWAQKYNQTI